MNIKIAIIDDHPMIIGGLQKMIANYTHITLTGTYSDDQELMEGLEKNIPDVLLLDIQLPGKTGDTLVPYLLKKYPDIRILVFTNFSSVVYANNMIRLGVSGYLLKTARQHTVIEAIEMIYNGGSFIEPQIHEKLNELSRKTRGAVFSKVMLTLREKEILRLILNGDTNQDIASRLFLGINTVKTYRKRIFLKLDVKNMAELAGKVLTMGLTE